MTWLRRLGERLGLVAPVRHPRRARPPIVDEVDEVAYGGEDLPGVTAGAMTTDEWAARLEQCYAADEPRPGWEQREPQLEHCAPVTDPTPPAGSPPAESGRYDTGEVLRSMTGGELRGGVPSCAADPAEVGVPTHTSAPDNASTSSYDSSAGSGGYDGGGSSGGGGGE